MKLFVETALIIIGMKEWFIPQISEHCPEYRPNRFAVMNVWLIRPGRASTFTPIDGMAHAWITSVEDTSTRIDVFTGINIISLVFIRRYILDVSMNVSNSSPFVTEYSWDQYH